MTMIARDMEAMMNTFLRGFFLLCAVTVMGPLVCAGEKGGDDARSRPSGRLRELIQEGRRAKTIEARKAVSEEMERSEPKTAEDVEVLAAELEGPLAPAAQEAISKAKDPSAVPVLIEAVKERRKKMRPMRMGEFGRMSEKEREEEINRRVSLGVLVETLAKHKDRRAIPVFKEMLAEEELRYQASTALSAMGDEALNDELVQRMEKERNINLANIKAPRLRKIVQEVDDPSTSQEKRGNLIRQIKGSRDPEVNATLKELALKHKNYDVRSQAGLALVNSVDANPEAVDRGFIVNWAGRPAKNIDEEDSKTWAIDAMEKTWTPEYIPVLIQMLKSRVWVIRSKSATLLGTHKITEAVPYLEEVLRRDKDMSARGSAWAALKAITGKEYVIEVTEAQARREYGEDWKRLIPPHYRLVERENQRP